MSQSQLPSTWLLLRLRRTVAGSPSATDAADRSVCSLSDPMLESLRVQRRAFRAAVSANLPENAISAFLLTWLALSSLPSDHALHMSHLFGNDQLQHLLRTEATTAFELDRMAAKLGPGIHGSGHTVLGGALGVGKTYILRGLAIVLSILCEAAMPVTLNYEAVGALATDHAVARAGLVPLSVLLDSFDLYTGCTSDDVCTGAVVRRSADIADSDVPALAHALGGSDLRAAGWLPFVLLDEVNAWYRKDMLGQRGSRLVLQLMHFGRRNNVHVVIAGSSSCLREQVYAQGSWSGGGYPSLNFTLFSYESIQPQRTVEQLRRYLFQTGATLPATLSLKVLLSLSSGVGRAVEDVLRGKREMNGRETSVALFLKDATFAMLATHMLTTPENAAVLSAAGDWPPPVGLPEEAVIAFLRNLGFGPVSLRLLESWCDGGSLFRATDPPRIEFLFPYHARLLWVLLSAPRQHLLNLARIQLHGVPGSLGHAFESLCRPQLPEIFIGASQRDDQLVMQSHVPKVVRGSEAARLFFPPTLLMQVIRWADEVGIEDFVLGREAFFIGVSGWQLKAPAVGTVMRAGVSVIDKIIADKHLGSASNAGALLSHASAKASWGFCALIAILTKSTQNAGSRPLSFLPLIMFLRTTAILDDGARAAAELPVEISADLVRAFNASAKCRALGCKCPESVAGATFRWNIRDGVDWTDTLLPRDMQGALRTPELVRRVEAARAALHVGVSRPGVEVGMSRIIDTGRSGSGLHQPPGADLGRGYKSGVGIDLHVRDTMPAAFSMSRPSPASSRVAYFPPAIGPPRMRPSSPTSTPKMSLQQSLATIDRGALASMQQAASLRGDSHMYHVTSSTALPKPSTDFHLADNPRGLFHASLPTSSRRDAAAVALAPSRIPPHPASRLGDAAAAVELPWSLRPRFNGSAAVAAAGSALSVAARVARAGGTGAA